MTVFHKPQRKTGRHSVVTRAYLRMKVFRLRKRIIRVFVKSANRRRPYLPSMAYVPVVQVVKPGLIKRKKKPSGSPQKGQTKGKGKSVTSDKHKAEKSSPEGNTALEIEFGKHVSVLRDIERLAEEELRPVDLQIIYMLKNHLSSKKEVSEN